MPFDHEIAILRLANNNNFIVAKPNRKFQLTKLILLLA